MAGRFGRSPTGVGGSVRTSVMEPGGGGRDGVGDEGLAAGDPNRFLRAVKGVVKLEKMLLEGVGVV